MANDKLSWAPLAGYYTNTTQDIIIPGIAIILLGAFSFYILPKLERRHAQRSDYALLVRAAITLWGCAAIVSLEDIVSFRRFIRNAPVHSNHSAPLSSPDVWETYFYIYQWVVDSLLTWRSVIILETRYKRYPHVLVAAIPLCLLVLSIGLGMHALCTEFASPAIAIAQLCSIIALKITLVITITWTHYMHIEPNEEGYKLSSRYLSRIPATISTLIECTIMTISLELFFFIPFVEQLGKLPMKMLYYFQVIAAFRTHFRVAYAIIIPILMNPAHAPVDEKSQTASDSLNQLDLSETKN